MSADRLITLVSHAALLCSEGATPRVGVEFKGSWGVFLHETLV